MGSQGRRSRALDDISHVAFMVLGGISLLTSTVVLWEIRAGKGATDGVDGVLGLVIIIPFGIPLLLASVLGPGLSLVLWRDRRRLALAALTIGLVFALSGLGYEAWPVILAVYGAACLTIGILWFIRFRRSSGNG